MRIVGMSIVMGILLGSLFAQARPSAECRQLIFSECDLSRATMMFLSEEARQQKIKQCLQEKTKDDCQDFAESAQDVCPQQLAQRFSNACQALHGAFDGADVGYYEGENPR